MKQTHQPAILGGSPITETNIPFVRPSLPPLEELYPAYQEIFQNGMVTTGPYAELFGEQAAAHLGVSHAIAVSSCTTGLMLTMQSFNLPRGSEVILPSFTFMASALGPVWNGLKLRFVDVDRESMNIDPQRIEEAIRPETSAIIAVHQFGNPAAIDRLEEIAQRHNLVLLFDAAHGFGSLYRGNPLGKYGNAEVFSMSPTKLVIAGEGGIVATKDASISEYIRYGRNYGNPGNYDCLFPGMNARMSELHAILASKSLQMLDEAATQRNRMANLYREQLAIIPGIGFQKIEKENRSSYKDFSITIDEEVFGLSQRQLEQALLFEGIHTRVYYSPVVHQMKAFRQYADPDTETYLPNTHYLETHALSLPMYSDMRESECVMVCSAIQRIHEHAALIRKHLS